MSYRSGLLAVLITVSACAQAGEGRAHPDGSLNLVDADKTHDAPPGTDGGTDAPTSCTTMMVNLLQNASFDGTPLATGWTETRYQNEPIIRTDGIAAQSGTTKAWLGGLTGTPAADALSQDIPIPASATALSLTGYYEVRTGETGTTVYDTGSIDLVSTADATLEAIKTFDNAHATTAWTTFSKTFASAHAGQTVRLKMKSTNDVLNATAFYFDTLALTATVCQ